MIWMAAAVASMLLDLAPPADAQPSASDVAEQDAVALDRDEASSEAAALEGPGDAVDGGRVLASSLGSVLSGASGGIVGALLGTVLLCPTAPDGLAGLGCLVAGIVLGGVPGVVLGAGLGAHFGPRIADYPPGNAWLSLLGSVLGATLSLGLTALFSELASPSADWPTTFGVFSFLTFIPAGAVLGDALSAGQSEPEP